MGGLLGCPHKFIQSYSKWSNKKQHTSTPSTPTQQQNSCLAHKEVGLWRGLRRLVCVKLQMSGAQTCWLLLVTPFSHSQGSDYANWVKLRKGGELQGRGFARGVGITGKTL